MIVRLNAVAKAAAAVHYNEHKVAHGEARFLGGQNAIAFEAGSIPIPGKIAVLDRYAQANPRIGKPALHLALAFHPSETLSDEQLLTIGTEYMDRLGYGHQPFLVYRHEDRPHPHIHIVSVSVDAQGKRISDAHQRQRSNAIRKALEVEHGLVQAEGRGKEVLLTGLAPQQALTTSEAQTKKAIGQVVRTAMTDYHFASLSTFRAFLAQHQIQLNALSGTTPGGQPYQGITFQLLASERGLPIGPAIKASRFGFAPTADRLQARFARSQPRLEQGAGATRQRIESVISQSPAGDLAGLGGQLRQAGIQLIDTGQELVYIDHQTRHVYGEAQLGAAYGRGQVLGWLTSRNVDSPQRVAPATARVPANPNPILTQPDQSLSRQAGPIQAGPIQAGPSASEIALRKRVSHYYQQGRQSGFDGQPPTYFDSQLIARFPVKALTSALLREGIDPAGAQKAVAAFEAYKQGQLPQIRAKVDAYFQQTAHPLLTLAGQLPLAAGSKRAFLQAAGYTLDGEPPTRLRHAHNPDLQLPLTPHQTQALLTTSGPPLAFPASFSKAERQLYGALATNAPLPAGISFYQLSGAHLLQAVGAERLATLSAPLNQAYLEAVNRLIDPHRPWPEQLRERGLLIVLQADGRYRAGYAGTAVASFSPVPAGWVEPLKASRLPSLADQLALLQTKEGRLLVRLTQALDTGNQPLMRQLTSGHYPPTVDGARAMLTRLRQLWSGQATPVPQPAPTGRPTYGATPLSSQPKRAETARGVARIVDWLAKTQLSVSDRSALARQLGIRFQNTPTGRRAVDATDKEAYANLTAGQTTGFSPPGPSTGERPMAHQDVSLQPTERSVLRSLATWVIDSGTAIPLPPLSLAQLAGLRPERIQRLLPPPMQEPVGQAYAGAYAEAILALARQQANGPFGVGSALKVLYQRGFQLERTGPQGVPTLHLTQRNGSVTIAGAPVPLALARALEADSIWKKQTRSGETRSGETRSLYHHPSWPPLASAQGQLMQQLARQLDRQGDPQRLLQYAHHRWPSLTSITDANEVLNRLSSQPKREARPTKATPGIEPVSGSAVPGRNAPPAQRPPADELASPVKPASTPDTPTGSLLDTTPRVRKKRLGQDDTHRPKGRRR